jgi:hypothetical protein
MDLNGYQPSNERSSGYTTTEAYRQQRHIVFGNGLTVSFGVPAEPICSSLPYSLDQTTMTLHSSSSYFFLVMLGDMESRLVI